MSETTAVVGLDITPRPGEALDDKVRRAGQAKALVAFVKDVEDAARADLQAEVEQVAALTGTGFSAKVDGIRATLTNPQPRPRISDMEAFGPWWADHELEHEVREYVEVIDQLRAIDVLRTAEGEHDYPDSYIADNLVDSLAVRTEYVLPAKPLDLLIESGKARIIKTQYEIEDGVEIAAEWDLIDTATGEIIPGVDVDPPAKPTLQVVPDKAARARDGAIVASFFGMSAEIGGAS